MSHRVNFGTELRHGLCGLFPDTQVSGGADGSLQRAPRPRHFLAQEQARSPDLDDRTYCTARRRGLPLLGAVGAEDLQGTPVRRHDHAYLADDRPRALS
jgi:hypothetical protein